LEQEEIGGKKRSQRRGPCAVITTKGILRFDPVTGEAVLRSTHPGVSLEEIREIPVGSEIVTLIEETESPSDSELRIIRKHDPKGFGREGLSNGIARKSRSTLYKFCKNVIIPPELSHHFNKNHNFNMLHSNTQL